MAASARIKLERRESEVIVDVEDDGPGVPADQRESVFEPFVRLNEQGTRGAGLGLAAARSIARAHGGDVVILDNTGGAPCAGDAAGLGVQHQGCAQTRIIVFQRKRAAMQVRARFDDRQAQAHAFGRFAFRPQALEAFHRLRALVGWNAGAAIGDDDAHFIAGARSAPSRAACRAGNI